MLLQGCGIRVRKHVRWPWTWLHSRSPTKMYGSQKYCIIFPAMVTMHIGSKAMAKCLEDHHKFFRETAERTSCNHVSSSWKACEVIFETDGWTIIKTVCHCQKSQDGRCCLQGANCCCYLQNSWHGEWAYSGWILCFISVSPATFISNILQSSSSMPHAVGHRRHWECLADGERMEEPLGTQMLRWYYMSGWSLHAPASLVKIYVLEWFPHVFIVQSETARLLFHTSAILGHCKAWSERRKRQRRNDKRQRPRKLKRNRSKGMMMMMIGMRSKGRRNMTLKRMMRKCGDS